MREGTHNVVVNQVKPFNALEIGHSQKTGDSDKLKSAFLLD